MEITEFIKKYKYSCLGAIIGLFVAVVIMLISSNSLLGWIAATIPTALVSGVFGGFNGIAESADWFLPGKLNGAGLLLTFFFYLSVFTTFGLLTDYFRLRKIEPLALRLLSFPAIFILAVLAFFYANASESVLRCYLVMDGDERLNRSNCFYHKFRYGHADLMDVDFCNRRFNPVPIKGMGLDYYGECLYVAAQVGKDTNICDQMRDEAGIYNKNMEINAGQRIPLLKSSCYADLAKKLHDKSICELAPYPETQELCRRDFYDRR